MTGGELAAKRASIGLTQKQFAERLGVSLRHYQRLEAGTWAIRKPLETAVRASRGRAPTPPDA